MAGATFTYKITTAADLRAFQAVETSLKRQIALAVSGGKDISALQMKLARVQGTMAASGAGGGGGLRTGIVQATQRAAMNLPGVGGAGLTVASAGGPAAIAAYTAVAAAVGLAAKALADFAEKQVAVADLDQVLQNQGQLTDEYREKLQGLANTMEEATNIADDQWLGALTKLTQEGANAGNIDALTEATKNFSAITGGDAVSSAESLGRAMKGQFTAFTRMGIVIDKTATQTQKMDSLMQQLAQRGGGILENRTKTLSGEFATLKTATGNFTEGLGNLINRGDGANRILAGLSTALKFWGDLLPQTIAKTVEYGNALPPVSLSVAELEESTRQAAEESKRFTEANTASVAALNAEIAAIDKKRQRLDSVTDATTALKLAQIDAAEAAGTKTGSQAGVERAQVRAEAEKEKAAREVAAIAERESALIKASDADLKSIAATEAERAELNRIITKELATQESIVRTKKFERTVGGADPKIQEALNKEHTASKEKSLAAQTELEGLDNLAVQKKKAVDDAEAKRAQERADNAARLTVLGLQGQTSKITTGTEVGKSRATAGVEDNAAQAKQGALSVKNMLAAPMDIFNPNAPRSESDAATKILGAGAELTTAQVRQREAILKVLADSRAETDALAVALKTRNSAPSARP